MKEQLRFQLNQAALEALSDEAPGGFFDKLTMIVANEFNGLKSKFSANEEAVPLSRDQAKFVREIAKHNYLDLVPLTAYVPEGLNVPYLDYAMRLDASVDHVTQIIDRVLAPYAVFLSQLISNTDQKFSTASMDHVFAEMELDRNEANRALGGCFVNGSTKVEAKYGDVIARNADWPAVFQKQDHLSKEINKVDRGIVNKKIAECAQLVEAVTNKIKRGEFEGVSPEVVKNLAEGAYQVAVELEYYSVTYYKVAALSNAINRTADYVMRIVG